MPGRQVLTAEQAKAIRVDPGYFKDCSDAILMTTRGGDQYDRTFMDGFLTPGIGPENWVSRTNYPALERDPDRPGRDVASSSNQDYGQPTTHLRRYSLRLDGFTAVRRPVRGGRAGDEAVHLRRQGAGVNFATSAAGGILVEIQDEAGRRSPASRWRMPSRRSATRSNARCAGRTGSDVSPLAGKPVRLRFVMKDAELFSLQFRQ